VIFHEVRQQMSGVAAHSLRQTGNDIGHVSSKGGVEWTCCAGGVE